VVAFLSATQDIAVDAYRAYVLENLEMPSGAAIAVLGYRIALLISGGLALSLADLIPWSMVYLVMAMLMIFGIGAAVLAPEASWADRELESPLTGSKLLRSDLEPAVTLSVSAEKLESSNFSDDADLPHPPTSFKDSVILPFQEFFSRSGPSRAS